VKRPRRRRSAYNGKLDGSSPPESDTGEERAGEDKVSSKSEMNPASSDAAKLLDISASETNAKDDCVDAVEVVDVVRSRADSRDGRGSSCHVELATSTVPYRRP
jgi:hypothetical protein